MNKTGDSIQWISRRYMISLKLDSIGWIYTMKHRFQWDYQIHTGKLLWTLTEIECMSSKSSPLIVTHIIGASKQDSQQINVHQWKAKNQISLEINITEYQITSFLQPIVLKLNYPNIMNMLTKIDYKKIRWFSSYYRFHVCTDEPGKSQFKQVLCGYYRAYFSYLINLTGT